MTGRRHIPLGVKVQALLLRLGFSEAQVFGGGIDWDHSPPLALRVLDPETGELVPPANDPRHLYPMARAEHREKTAGPAAKASALGTDRHAIDKTRRCARKNAEFNRRLAEKSADEKPRPSGRKIPSRPFQTRKRGKG